MAEISSNFLKFESPFKVLEDLDLNYQTPTSSTRVQRKILFNSTSAERHNRMTFWRERFVVNKHPLQITTLGLITPPMDKLLSIQPLAPIKPRKSMNKMDLKPKKLIFKDIEESEVETPKYPTKFIIKHDDIVNERQPKSKNLRRKQMANDEKENQRGLLFFQNKTNESNNDKVNLFKAGGSSSSNSGINNNTALLLTQSQNSHIKGALKHFRI